MSRGTACIAYRSERGICTNGFIQTVYCHAEIKCSGCGRHSEGVPHCMKDELPEHWLNDDGSPRFYQGERSQ